MAIALITYVAEAVPLNNVGTDYLAENVRDALLEIDFRQARKEPTGLLDRSQSTISFDNITRTFSLGLTGIEIIYYIRGRRWVVAAQADVTITDTAGLWYFYLDNTGALVATQTKWGPSDAIAQVATGLWSVTDQDMILLIDSRHGIAMDWSTLYRLESQGPALSREGFNVTDTITNGNGTLDAHATFGLTTGTIFNQDIVDTVVHSATPTNDYEQILNTIANIPMYYRSGATGEWRKIPATQFAMATDAPNAPFWNEWTGATWQLTNIVDGFYAATIIAITSNPAEPVVGIVPQFTAGNIIAATKDIFDQSDLTGFPIDEAALIRLGVYEGNSTFTNNASARYVAFSGIGGLEEQIDRYAVLANYGGQANTGRYLEVVPGEASDTAPFYFPEDSYIRTVTVQIDAVGSPTIGFFEINDLVTPRFEVSVAATTEAVFDVSELFVKDERLAIRITANNCQKPKVRFWIETSVS
jgi:hypothetical protein